MKAMDQLSRKAILCVALSALLAGTFALDGIAQNPQTHDVPSASATEPLAGINARWANGIAPGYWATAGAGLTLNLSAGTVNCSGAIETYAGGTLTMVASATNYVYLDISASCAPASNTTGFSSNIPIAEVAASASAITTITDDRTMFTVPPTAAVLSVFGRNGAVTAQGGDYSASQVTNAFDLSVSNNLGAHYFDIGTQAAPTAPASGSIRVYADSTSGDLACINSSGTSCMPTTGSNYADAEVPSGGAGTSFTLAHTPSPAASLVLVWDGLVRKQGTDYTLSGNTITTYTSVNPAGDNLQAWYRY